MEVGLYYVSSRYYDPETGRIISADTTDILEVQSDLYDKNLYAYCDNNPVMRADSGGEDWITVGIMAIGGAIGATIGALSSMASQYAFTGNINWKSVGVAAIGGLVSGAVAASSLGLGAQIGVGSLIGASSYVVDCKVNFKTVKVDELIVATCAGAVSGYIGGSGANQYNAMSNTVKTSMKTTAKLSRKSTAKYVAKRIAATKSWRNNRLAVSGWSSSAKFSVGTGVSNTITSVWTKVKKWFLGLVK